jgi:hypothetical protein
VAVRASLPGTYERAREGSNVFAGGGVAWTPLDADNQLFSLQLGLSHETTFDERLNGVHLSETGRSGVFAHPTVLYDLSQRVLFFGQTTFPIHQTYGDVNNRERFRIGAGVIVKVSR